MKTWKIVISAPDEVSKTHLERILTELVWNWAWPSGNIKSVEEMKK
jgi:hypothetical protein